MKPENLQLLMKCFFNEGLVMFDKEIKVFYKMKQQLQVKTAEHELQLSCVGLGDKILQSSCNVLQHSSFVWLPTMVTGFHSQSTEILENFFLTIYFSSASKNFFCFQFFQASLFYYAS